ncbi:MAG: ATP synthase gamma chain [Microgenomates group bacterium GW2011_GWC1_43_11]|uniref:ATP synthase gamma chain n=1 Tax=Candidatus Gottesmanbacteria bacterium GW2011_GWA1_44_24b TaxID=1618437 RepID=A0A0G1IQB2_9BACT|nr:MAG: ATP synthase gamma chain [Microgenomates group bacterium GW2011_GWC1_43_11]KKT61123.1 MAG: ATP synthase F1, gamma subunit [Candidatus Gottesmanbacteria bacterium GW2011_GWA1_44_24b]HCM82090.1 ATP synthase F1 subunit gamma [Patescibacteria group bacterium]
MASIRLLRGRIKSVKNIAQITKAMEMVAASKMKKAQAQALSGKLYAQKIFDMVMELGEKSDSRHHPLLTKPAQTTGRRLILLLSTNKGLCGSLNTNLLRFFLETYPNVNAHDYVSIGKKGANLLVRMGGSLIADFSQSNTFVETVPALADLAVSGYLSYKYDGVDLVWNEFFSALKQHPVKKTILPLTMAFEQTKSTAQNHEFLIEPTISEVFDRLLPHYIENQIRDAILQAEASEHSARMIAMRNATDNARSRIDDLTLMYNKARQEKITYEISDMITARMTMS